MKKIYMTPATRWTEIEETAALLANSDASMDTLGREYNPDDVSYGREVSSKNLWDSEW